MNKLVLAVKERWKEEGVSGIILNNRCIGGDVHSIYLHMEDLGDKNQYNESYRSFGKIEKLDLSLYVLDKIQSDVGALPDHLREELVELLSNDKPIPSMEEIRERAEAHQRYVTVLEIIEDWNENMVGVGFERKDEMNEAILGEFDHVLNERTGKNLTKDFKAYLGYLIEEGNKLPSFDEIEEMNTMFAGEI
ncbi:hypothetical protein [Burkholderia cenocepacia]|uniref:hypothetical protein n=1 Tax=Burkholderia cenocepacia TaxID=95486 RepID=UPI002237ED13|nr:hypothetical protein [Burkholderia cenocepacia]MCW5156371.1 hypothetical protein [Burkholderia cenocepacia]